ncbi:MAG: hypothetical protein AAGB12_01390, partial [Pseudomonadota bacterium]
ISSLNYINELNIAHEYYMKIQCDSGVSLYSGIVTSSSSEFDIKPELFEKTEDSVDSGELEFF